MWTIFLFNRIQELHTFINCLAFFSAHTVYSCDCCSLVVDTWQKMGQEKNLSPSIVDHLLDTLSRCQPYEELTNVDAKTKKLARRAVLMPFTVWPLYALSLCYAASLWCGGATSAELIVAPVLRHFYTEPKALCLLVRLGCLYGVDVPLLCNYSEDYNYMVCMHVVKVVRACTGEWVAWWGLLNRPYNGTCFISEVSALPTVYACPRLTAIPYSPDWWLHIKVHYASPAGNGEPAHEYFLPCWHIRQLTQH